MNLLLLLLSVNATVIRFKSEPSNTSAGETMASFTVGLRNDADNADETTPLVEIKLFPSTGNPGLSGTLIKNTDANGEAVFNDLVVDNIGTGYKIVAISNGINSQESSTFDITAGGVSDLVVTLPAGPFTVGGAFSPTVEATDSAGNTLSSFSDAVTLTLIADDADSAAITGTTTRNPAGGTATFSGIAIDKQGTFYLEASTATHSGYLSAQFTVAAAAQPNSISIVAPEKVTVGEKFSITASILQESDALAAARVLTLSKGSGPGTVTDDGSTHTTSGGTGIVTIANIVIDTAGDYTLSVDCSSAQCGTLVQGISATIVAEDNSYVIYTLPSVPRVFQEDLTNPIYTWNIKLSREPSDTVQLALTSPDIDVILSTTSLTFNSGNYGVDQQVDITLQNSSLLSGADEAYKVYDITAAITTTDPGYSNAQFDGCDQVDQNSGTFGFIIYQEKAEAILYPTVSNIIQDQGTNNIQYKIKAQAAPSADVVITAHCSSFSFDTATVTISTGTTESDQVQFDIPAITATLEGYREYDIYHTVNPSNVEYANALMLPNPVKVVVKTPVQSALVKQSKFPVFTEGSNDSYTLQLDPAPDSSVVINLSTSDPIVQLSPTTVTLTSGSPSATITVDSTSPVYRASEYKAYILHQIVTTDLNYSGDVAWERGENLLVQAMSKCTELQYLNGLNDCQSCPQDFECPSPFDDKVACGTGEYSPANQINCLVCPPGHECSTGSPVACNTDEYSLNGACVACPFGKSCADKYTIRDCPDATYFDGTSCAGCPVGKYCVDGEVLTCATGQFSMGGASRCKTCPDGYDCSNAASIVVCGAGSYSDGAGNCLQCPQGSYCSTYGITGTCAEGFYSEAGWGRCEICPAGSACTGGLISACLAGEYAPIGHTLCTACKDGFMCPLGSAFPSNCEHGQQPNADNSDCEACATNKFSIAGKCQDCPAGHECPAVDIFPRMCRPGTYAALADGVCTICDAGKVCGHGSIVQNPTTDCPMGFTCTDVGGVIKVEQCAGGTYSKVDGTLAKPCSSCEAGFFCPPGCTDSKLWVCPPGHWCEASASSPMANPCPENTYNPDFGAVNNTSCDPCPERFFCPEGSKEPHMCRPGNYCGQTDTTEVACPPGTFSPQEGQIDNTTCLQCPAGYYCPGGSIRPVPCAQGTYNGTPGQNDLSHCLPCTAGYECPQMAMTEAVKPCPKGYACAEGTITGTAGCLAGTYGTAWAAVDTSGCSPCPAGFACAASTNDAWLPKEMCERGYYCEANTETRTQTGCAGGTYSYQIGLKAATDCTACPEGHSCPQVSLRPLPCDRGYFCPKNSAAANANPCPVGTYSNKDYLSNSAECSPCPKGYYCLIGAIKPTPCAAGTYRNAYSGEAPGDCQACPEGYYCLSAQILPIACGKGYFSAASQTAQSGCQICTAGRYCPDEATTITNKTSPYLCPAGLLCEAGTDHIPTNLYDRCPAGHYCVEATTAKAPCAAGKIRPLPGGAAESDCIDVYPGTYGASGGASEITGECAAGYYCEGGDTSASATPCPGGTFRSLTRGTRVEDCAKCPAGYYCPLATATPIPCIVGHFCIEETAVPTPCPVGTFSPDTNLIRESDCFACNPGQFCAQPGLIATEGPCDAGYYCLENAIVSNPTDGTTGALCPAGGYCPQGSARRISCAPGFFSTDVGQRDNSSCQSCTQGYYCSGAAVSSLGDSEKCDAGFYCTGGASTPSQNYATVGHYTDRGATGESDCLSSTYGPNKGLATCPDCPIGHFCGSDGMTIPTICTAGNYCGLGVATVSPCNAGTYNSETGQGSSDSCQQCTAGHACLSPAKQTIDPVNDQCDAGYWCEKGSSSKTPSDSTQVGECIIGHYCVQGSQRPLPCPKGKYSPTKTTAAVDDTHCEACTGGKYCDEYGLSDITSKNCEEGYYCPQGSKSIRETICEKGHICGPGVLDHFECAEGYYQPNFAATNCLDCPAGFKCTNTDDDFVDTPCDAGYYCVQNSSDANKAPCNSGQYNPNSGSMTSDACLECPPGKFCSGQGQSTVGGDCGGGYFCEQSETEQNPTGNECTAGYYCPTGSTSPKQCDVGKFCSTSQIPDISANTFNCQQGYFCELQSTSATENNCPAGSYCEAGASAPVACSAGTYSNTPNAISSTTCDLCDAGFYCDQAALTDISTKLCTEGFYCPQGSKSSKETPCDAGYYCPQQSPNQTQCDDGTFQAKRIQGSCIDCPKGFYCNDVAENDSNGNAITLGIIEPKDCTVGNYCGPRSTGLTPCPAGDFNPLRNLTAESECAECPPGKYCSGGLDAPDGVCDKGYACTGLDSTKDEVSNICTAGNVCAAGSTQEIKCPVGKYCALATDGSNLVLDPVDCDAGYLCLGGATVSNPTDGTTGKLCEQGYYCGTGARYQVACGIGTYNPTAPTTGSPNTTDAVCETCPNQKYCASKALTAVSGACAPKFFCETGEITQWPNDNICTAGNYCPGDTSAPVPCLAGYYNKYIGQSVCVSCPTGHTCAGGSALPVICPVRYYCGAQTDTALICPSTKYNKWQGQTICFDCPAGFYCPEGSETPSTCQSGHYCTAGLAAGIPCPDGTYSTVQGLQKEEQCQPCPAGSYCIGGVITALCDAGHYCISKNTVQNPANDPTDDNVNWVGIECPVGHYCLSGTTVPIPCESGKFTANPGADEASDCTVCTAGFYCIPGDPVQYPCTPGSYCPEASSEPILCPRYTYTQQVSAIAVDACLPCPEGYFCDREGVGNYVQMPCDPGKYCAEGTEEMVDCGDGTWSPNTAGICSPCPSGDYCTKGVILSTACDEWEWCQAGTGPTTIDYCPRGYICNFRAIEPIMCYGGYYCPAFTDYWDVNVPFKCPLGTYCPAGSYQTTPCPAGTKGYDYAWRVTADLACLSCGDGKYPDDTGDCLPCDAGYSCPDGAAVPNPTDLETQGGEPCWKGHYCPEQTGIPLECPVGTYNDETGGTSLDSCRPCKKDSFNDLEGQIGCFACGPNATAEEGSDTCDCIGSKRAYMKRDGTCRCVPGFEFYQDGLNEESIDSDQDCVPLVRDTCTDPQVRGQDGSCVDRDCTEICDDGYREPEKGICICRKQNPLEEICNQQCQDRSANVTLASDGTFKLTYPGSLPITVDYQSIDGYFGPRINCYEDLSCEVRNIKLSASGKYESKYVPDEIERGYEELLNKVNTVRRQLNLDPLDNELHNWFQSQNNSDTYFRQLQSETYSLENPIMCLQLGETMVFAIESSDHYPVYEKDSLLNSNLDFDYGPFLELENVIKKGDVEIKSFAYTFREAGRYAFSDSSSDENVLLISVMDKGELCNEPYVREKSETTLPLFGFRQTSDILEEINWLVYGLLLAVLFLFLLSFAAIYYFHRRSQKDNAQKQKTEFKRAVASKQSIIKREVTDVIADVAGGHLAEAREDVNPQLFQDIYAQLIKNLDLVQNWMTGGTEGSSGKDLSMLTGKVKVLRDIIKNALKSKSIKEIEQEEAKNPVVLSIENDPNLNDEEKKALLNELEENNQRLQSNIAENKAKGDNALKKRLQERAARRRMAVQRKEELDKEQTKIQDNITKLNKEIDMLDKGEERAMQKEKIEINNECLGEPAKKAHNKMKKLIQEDPKQAKKARDEYERTIAELEANLEEDAALKYNQLQQRLAERRAKRNQNKEVAEKQEQLERLQSREVRNAEQLEIANREIEAFTAIDSAPVVEEAPVVAVLNQNEEKKLEKKYKQRQKEVDEPYEKQKEELEWRKNDLARELANTSGEEDRARLIGSIEEAEEALAGVVKAQEQRQRDLLEERLRERRAMRQKKNEAMKRGATRGATVAGESGEGGPGDAERTAKRQAKANEEKKARERLGAIETAVSGLPDNEALRTVKELLADKHDHEVTELNEKHQRMFNVLQEEALQELIATKSAAIKDAADHLAPGTNIDGILLNLEQENQANLDQKWQEHNKAARQELNDLLDRQVFELHELLNKLGLEEHEARLSDELKRKQNEIKRDEEDALEQLNLRKRELDMIANEKRVQFERAEAQTKKSEEFEARRRALALKQQKEIDAMSHSNPTQDQIDQLIANHKKELAMFDSAFKDERERQSEILAKRLEAKRAARRERLQIPKEMEKLSSETIVKISAWKKSRHRMPYGEFYPSDNILLEILRRVERIEAISKNVKGIQIENIVVACNDLAAALSSKS